jgi:hypothetical protein
MESVTARHPSSALDVNHELLVARIAVGTIHVARHWRDRCVDASGPTTGSLAYLRGTRASGAGTDPACPCQHVKARLRINNEHDGHGPR